MSEQIHEKPLRLAVKELTKALKEKDAEIERLKGYLDRANWRRCDIPACNCNGYHNWNPSREEIEEPLREEVERLKGELAEALAVLREIADATLPSKVGGAGSGYTIAKRVGLSARAFLQKHTPPNCGSVHRYERPGYDQLVKEQKQIEEDLQALKATVGESPSHSGGGVKCEPDCRMCSGEYCKIHLNKPCDCDCLDRHGIFQDQKQQKPGGAS